jgi:hypothetical protein
MFPRSYVVAVPAESGTIDGALEISVGVAAYRQPEEVTDLLASIRRSYQEFEDGNGPDDVNLECVICCYREDDRTIAAVSEFDWSKLALVTSDYRAPGYNRDRAFDICDGDYLVCLDGDCIVESDWVDALVRAVREHECPGAVQGAYYLGYSPESDWFTEAEERVDRARFERGDADSRNVAFRADVYDAIGEYDTTYFYSWVVSDLTLRDRIESRGEAFVLDDRVRAKHRYPPGLTANLFRQLTYGRGVHHLKAYDERLYRERFAPRSKFEYALGKLRDALRSRRNDDLLFATYMLAKAVTFLVGRLHGLYVAYVWETDDEQPEL